MGSILAMSVSTKKRIEALLAQGLYPWNNKLLVIIIFAIQWLSDLKQNNKMVLLLIKISLLFKKDFSKVIIFKENNNKVDMVMVSSLVIIIA